MADGRVVATSGSAVAGESTGYNNSAEVWDPTTGTWLVGPSAQKMRLYHSNAILLPDASVLTSGGGRDRTASRQRPEQEQPELRGLLPVVPVRRRRRAGGAAVDHDRADRDRHRRHAQHHDEQRRTASARVTLVKTGSVSHSFNFEQRFMDLTFRASGNQVAIQAPTHAADAPPGFYMLFVFDTQGVPSVAKIVRVNVASTPNPAVTPVLTSPGAQTSLVGAAVALALAATDPNGDTLSYGAAGLPPGLTINATTGRIAGTPTAAGTYSVVVSATDGLNSASQSFTLDRADAATADRWRPRLRPASSRAAAAWPTPPPRPAAASPTAGTSATAAPTHRRVGSGQREPCLCDRGRLPRQRQRDRRDRREHHQELQPGGLPADHREAAERLERPPRSSRRVRACGS